MHTKQMQELLAANGYQYGEDAAGNAAVGYMLAKRAVYAELEALAKELDKGATKLEKAVWGMDRTAPVARQLGMAQGYYEVANRLRALIGGEGEKS